MTAKYAIVLAAGQGTRMKSKLYKVLHPVCGKAMVDHVLTELEKDQIDEIVTIVGHGAAKVEETLGKRTKYALQAEQCRFCIFRPNRCLNKRKVQRSFPSKG